MKIIQYKCKDKVSQNKMILPEPIMLNIFSYAPSFVFCNRCKTILKYDIETTTNLVYNYYFQYMNNRLQIQNYIILDYFIYHRHLLILDNNHHFENYLKENRWLNNIPMNTPASNKDIIQESLRNIMRLSYFVKCLREIEKQQRQISIDKIEQSNIGVSFQYLIESIHNESEFQTKLLKQYLEYKKIKMY